MAVQGLCLFFRSLQDSSYFVGPVKIADMSSWISSKPVSTHDWAPMLAWMKALILAASAALSAATPATTFEHTPMNRIDTTRPDAPVLAGYGDFQIGVRTLTLVDERRVDILNTKAGLALRH